MLVSAKEMLTKAREGKYAVGQFNINNLEWTKTILLTAQELNSPVILGVSEGAGKYMGGFKTVSGMVNGLLEGLNITVPVALHLDHGTYEGCYKCIEAGFSSIMFDGSALPVEENAAATEAVARVCRSFGVPLEAEIGELCRLDDRGNKIGASNIADPDVVRQYLKLCHPDSLAIGIGNAHGFYSGPVDIRVEVLEECRKFTDIPFVLHGCTGMDEELVKRSIDSGVAKINFGTQVRCQYVNYLKEGLAEGKDQGHAWKLSQYAELRLREDIKDIIRLAGSKEKA